jgi:SAM-dependent methyltransferase
MSETLILEPVRCYACGSDRRRPILTGPDHYRHVPGAFSHCRCLDCGLIYQCPRPGAGAFAAIYPEEYAPYQPAAVTPASVHPDLRAACRLIDRLQPGGGELLDVGCGPGNFLLALRLLLPQWRGAGVEPGAHAARSARQRGLDVEQAWLESARLAERAWDAVTLWNVLEHLPDPLEALVAIRRLLRPSGVLYLAVPMADSWDARVLGPYWMGWELPRHFVVFSRDTLRALLGRAGFAIVATACINGVEWNVTESLRLLIGDRVERYALRRLGVAVTYSRPFRLLLRPFVKLTAAARRSTVLTVAARPVDP